MNLKQSLLRTLKYTASFSYPLTVEESHYWLMSDQLVAIKDYKKALAGISLPKQLEPYLIKKISQDRVAKREQTDQKLQKAQSALKILKNIPFIWYIGLTGSLSMDNSEPDSDVDLMLVLHPYTLWVIRPLIALLFSARHLPIRFSGTSKVKDAICINLYLDARSLAIAKGKQNFYVAHEILQIRTLFDRGGLYQAFLEANPWVSKFYANAYADRWAPVPKIAENRLFSVFLCPVNFLLYIAQKAYMSGKITIETISLTQAFFHPHNPYKRLKTQVGLE